MLDNKPKMPTQGPAGLSGEVADEVHPFLKSLSENIVTIIVVVVVFLAGLGGYLIYKDYQETNQEEAANEMGEILLLTEGELRRDALEGFLDRAPSSMEQSILFELIRVSLDLEEYDAALGYWDRIEVEGSTEKVLAMGRARTLSLAGRHDEALALLDELRLSVPESFDLSLMRLYASIAETSGDLETAKATYEEMLAMSQADVAYVKFKIARLAEEIGG